MDRRSWPFPLSFTPEHKPHHTDFRGFVINGSAIVGVVAGFYGLGVSAVHHGKTIADYLGEYLFGYPLTGDRVPLGGAELIVLRICDHVVERVGLDFSRPAAIARARSRAPAQSGTRQ
jgi:NhaP-type Na+/H+ and K+/H+ antiporter